MNNAKLCPPVISVLLLFAFWWVQPVGAQGVTPPLPTVVSSDPSPEVERLVIRSQTLNSTKELHVLLPERYHQRTQSYPVMVVLDGEFLFYTVGGIVRHWSAVTWMPEMIVVGVSYERRPPLSAQPEAAPPSGGLGSRAAFLRDELIPFLDSRYRTQPFRMIVGLNPSSIPILENILKAPGLFQANIAIVAGHSLRGRGRRAMGLAPEETFPGALAESFADDPERQSYLYISSPENHIEQFPTLPRDFQDLEREMMPYTARRFTLRTEFVAGDAYATAQASVLSALDMIFPRDKWAPQYSDLMEEEGAALANIEAYFDNLSSAYGFTITPLEDRFRNINSLVGSAFRLVQQERFEEATAVSRHAIELFPNTVGGRYQLARALEGDGRLREAEGAAEQALAKAREFDNYELAEGAEALLQQIRDRLAATKE
jgi:tetratricopeptide (TPR) repeat protein